MWLFALQKVAFRTSKGRIPHFKKHYFTAVEHSFTPQKGSFTQKRSTLLLHIIALCNAMNRNTRSYDCTQMPALFATPRPIFPNIANIRSS